MLRMDLFPDTSRVDDERLTIAGVDLGKLSDLHGTPLYVYDRQTMDNSVQAYRSALKAYTGISSLTYACKAFLCLAVAEWAQDQGMRLDCSGAGEIGIARAAGVPPERIIVHGVNKSIEDLNAAFQFSGTIVVDNLTELGLITSLAKNISPPDLYLRLQPGQAVDTHTHTQTGQRGSKFGMTPVQVVEAAGICKRNGLPLCGLHFHLGSQFKDPAPLQPAISMALNLAEELSLGTDWHLSPGGGWGVAYHEDDLPAPDVAVYVDCIQQVVTSGCRQRGMSLPRLHLEPGRSLVARAGVALYRVGTVKVSDGRTWALVDGGLADNPRPAMYGARYSASPVCAPGRPATSVVSIAGPYCESGDVLIDSLPMPELQVGDVIAIPVSGAYQVCMSSNYNGARRPAVLWLDDGCAQIIRERQSLEDLYIRDRRLAKPAGTG